MSVRGDRTASRAGAGRSDRGDVAKATGKRQAGRLRIIAGEFRGRTIRYHGSAFTRPMKDSVRENLFNIVGPALRGATCFDLFSGTGAIALESLSRGASSAVAVDASKLATRTIRDSAESLGVGPRLRVMTGDAFRLGERLLAPPPDDTPWAVFLCPPYRMWEDPEDFESLCHLIRITLGRAAPGSVLVAEMPKRFDAGRLPSGPWDLREYGETRLAIIEPASRCGWCP